MASSVAWVAAFCDPRRPMPLRRPLKQSRVARKHPSPAACSRGCMRAHAVEANPVRRKLVCGMFDKTRRQAWVARLPRLTLPAIQILQHLSNVLRPHLIYVLPQALHIPLVHFTKHWIAPHVYRLFIRIIPQHMHMPVIISLSPHNKSSIRKRTRLHLPLLQTRLIRLPADDAENPLCLPRRQLKLHRYFIACKCHSWNRIVLIILTGSAPENQRTKNPTGKIYSCTHPRAQHYSRNHSRTPFVQDRFQLPGAMILLCRSMRLRTDGNCHVRQPGSVVSRLSASPRGRSHPCLPQARLRHA